MVQGGSLGVAGNSLLVSRKGVLLVPVLKYTLCVAGRVLSLLAAPAFVPQCGGATNLVILLDAKVALVGCVLSLVSSLILVSVFFCFFVLFSK